MIIIRYDFGSVWNLRLLIQDYAGEFPGDVATMHDPNNYFLANIAALRETHRIVKVRFGHDITLIHVHAIAGDPGFEAQSFKGVFTNRFSSGLS